MLTLARPQLIPPITEEKCECQGDYDQHARTNCPSNPIKPTCHSLCRRLKAHRSHWRSVFLRRYFGEDYPPRCRTCDRCRADSVAPTVACGPRKTRHQAPTQARPRMHAPCVSAQRRPHGARFGAKAPRRPAPRMRAPAKDGSAHERSKQQGTNVGTFRSRSSLRLRVSQRGIVRLASQYGTAQASRTPWLQS